MARRRRQTKRKSTVKNFNPQLEGRPTSYKRKRKETMNCHQVNSKRRRTGRYNLREQSSSVVLIGETPCCQNPEQREKYARLGLNSALFLSSSRCLRRKQSHISIITISSYDEETGVERTSEWINNLDENIQCCREPEPDHLSVNSERELQEDAGCFRENVASTSVHLSIHVDLSQDRVKHEQNFQPLCASTPCNTADLQTLKPKQSEVLSETQKTLTFIKSPTGYQPDNLNEAKGLNSLSGSSHLVSKSHSNTHNICSENLNPVVHLENSVSQFYFGTPDISKNVIVTPTYPFHYYFSNSTEASKPDGFRIVPTSDSNMNDSPGISGTNQGAFTGGTLEKNTVTSTNDGTQSNSQHSNLDEIVSEKNTY